jgi:hypothetical protein
MNLLVGSLVKKYAVTVDILQAFIDSFMFIKPPPPGQKRVKEDWENIWYIGMFGTMAFAAVMLYYKPDTRCAPASQITKQPLCLLGIVYKRGLLKKRRREWRPGERNTDMNRRLHHNQYTLHSQHVTGSHTFSQCSKRRPDYPATVLNIY